MYSTNLVNGHHQLCTTLASHAPSSFFDCRGVIFLQLQLVGEWALAVQAFPYTGSLLKWYSQLLWVVTGTICHFRWNKQPCVRCKKNPSSSLSDCPLSWFVAITTSSAKEAFDLNGAAKLLLIAGKSELEHVWVSLHERKTLKDWSVHAFKMRYTVLLI